MNFNISPIDKLRVGIQLFSRDIGDTDNNRIDLDWAFADYRWRDYWESASDDARRRSVSITTQSISI